MKLTNGMLMVNIRHTIAMIVDEKVGIGRMKNLTMREVVLNHQSYCEWAATQLGGHPHSRLMQLVGLHRMFFRYYPQAKNPVNRQPAEEAKLPQEEWPEEPEAEVKPDPRAKAKAKAKASASSAGSGSPQVYSMVQEGEVDDGYISDSPPAWEEKKGRMSTTPQQGSKRK
jgi:hypothetical protein